jgi:hypothetical protein
MTKTESKLRLMGLEECMSSGKRYNDALWDVINIRLSGYELSQEEIGEAEDFINSFSREYIAYKRKMNAAGMS